MFGALGNRGGMVSLVKEKSIKWLMGVSALSCLVWIGGLAWSFQNYFSSSTPVAIETAPAAVEATPEPVGADDKFHLLAFGDSLTKGTGDPSGKGYVGYLLEHLQEKSKQEVTLSNYGVNGQTTSQLAVELQQIKVKNEIQAANVIAISIGANDLFQGGETLGNLDSAHIQQIEDKYLQQLDAILKQLRKENATARIFLIGLYNPFSALENAERTNEILREWNYKTSDVVARYPQIVLVPTADLFQLKVQDYLANDLFHPNAAGYRLMGDRVASLIIG
jgi:lysophospholipase L1-like esterase